ncbi:TPA: AbrB/MazE/SpoVT family DNA-binding domain-containing protein [Candidatus Bathyarchaeota archaeon]|nr:AbrB/MazE/SpoVT family DNA-binding domain-containing protein [Candidatus Bathyarchaeota archaeon]
MAVTSKVQVAIPSELRKELNIEGDEKLLVTRKGNAIKLIPMPKFLRWLALKGFSGEGKLRWKSRN